MPGEAGAEATVGQFFGEQIPSCVIEEDGVWLTYFTTWVLK